MQTVLKSICWYVDTLQGTYCAYTVYTECASPTEYKPPARPYIVTADCNHQVTCIHSCKETHRIQFDLLPLGTAYDQIPSNTIKYHTWIMPGQIGWRGFPYRPQLVNGSTCSSTASQQWLSNGSREILSSACRDVQTTHCPHWRPRASLSSSSFKALCHSQPGTISFWPCALCFSMQLNLN